MSRGDSNDGGRKDKVSTGDKGGNLHLFPKSDPAQPEANSVLLPKGGPTVLSPQARKAIERKLEEYNKNLRHIGQSIASEENVDSISEVHIERADEALGKKPPKRSTRLAEIAGGVLIGATISLTLASFAPSPDRAPWLFVMLGIAGGLLIKFATDNK